jgi:hypothetical protein
MQLDTTVTRYMLKYTRTVTTVNIEKDVAMLAMLILGPSHCLLKKLNILKAFFPSFYRVLL